MAYNLAQYNLSAFNVGSDGGIWLNVFFQENVTPAIGTSLEAYLKAIGNERVATGDMLCGNGVYIFGSATETVEEAVGYGMSSVILGIVEGREYIDERCTVMSVNFPSVSGEENISGETVLGSNIYPVASYTEQVEAEVVTDKETYLIAEGYELVSSSVTFEVVDIKVCELNITLKPGQRIVVDAENYNVLWNNQNAIHVQSGDWVDELTRETSSISITASAGANNLTASILYTERYL